MLNDEEYLEELADRWLVAASAGRILTATHLCIDRPDLMSQLAERIHILQQYHHFIPTNASATIDHIPTEDNTPNCNAETQPTFSIGTAQPELPQYTILRELGRGGMGVVYLARQATTGREVAVKMVLAGNYAGNQEKDRFRQEAEAIARLNHPNIIQIFHFDEYRGVPYFVLEYCGGGSLASIIQGQPWSIHAAIAVVETLAHAVAAAHAAGVIHRDLKPGNILLTRLIDPDTLATRSDATGELVSRSAIKLTDFGLAKLVDETAMTSSGAVMGTPSYMSPEQAAGRTQEVGPASDIYSLGAILYELITGRPPFRSANAIQTIRDVLEKDPVRPSKLNPVATGPLEAICLKCLEKEPWRRYASASDLANDLRNCASGQAITARHVGQWRRSWVWCQRNPKVAGLLATIAVSLFAGTIIASLFAVQASTQARRADREAAKANERAEAAEKAEQATAAAKRIADTELTRAEQLLYVATLDRAQLEWLHGNATDALKALHRTRWDLRGWEHDYLQSQFSRGQSIWYGHEGDRFGSVVIHPNGKQAATARWQDVAIWDTTLGQIVQFLPQSDKPVGATAIAYQPQGSILATLSSNELRLFDSITGTLIRTITADKKREFSYFTWAPDGQELLTIYGERIVSWNLEGKQLVEIPHGDLEVREIAIHPRKNSLAISGYVQENRQTRLLEYPTGKLLWTAGNRDPVFSPDGSKILVSDRETINILDARTGKTLASAIGHQGSVLSIAFSPNGKQFLSCANDNTIRLWDTSQGTALDVFQGHTDLVSGVAWAPDGQWFLSIGNDDTVRRWSLKQRQKPLEIAVPGHFIRKPVLARDGRCLVTWVNRELRTWDTEQGLLFAESNKEDQELQSVVFVDEGRHLLTVNCDTDRIKKTKVHTSQLRIRDCRTLKTVQEFALRGYVTHATVSPDGLTLATVRQLDPNTNSKHEVTLWELPTGKLLRTLSGEFSDAWGIHFSPDGTRIATVNGFNEGINIWDVPSGVHIRSFAHPRTAAEITFNATGDLLALTNGDEPVQIWDVLDGKQVLTLADETANARGVAFTLDGQRVLVGTFSHRVVVCEANTGQLLLATPSTEACFRLVTFGDNATQLAGVSIVKNSVTIVKITPSPVRVLNASDSSIRALHCSPDGTRLCTGIKSDRPQIWNVHTGRVLSSGPKHRGNVFAVSYHPHGNLVASSGEDGVRIWDSMTGKEQQFLDGYRGAVKGVHWLSDGNTLVTYANILGETKAKALGAEIVIWNTATGTRLQTWEAHKTAGNAFAVSPNGHFVATAASDGTIRMWQLTTGQLIAEWEADPTLVRAIQFSPDSRLLATVGSKTGVVWHVDNCTKAFELKGHRGSIVAVSFNHDGTRLFTAGEDLSIREWSGKDGQQVRVHWGHATSISALTTARDGRTLYSATYEGQLLVWQIAPN